MAKTIKWDDKITWDGIDNGDELAPLVKGTITKDWIRRYAKGGGDPNPIHVDENFAKMAGYKGVFAHGMLSMGFCGQFVVDRFGVGNVKKFGVRFTKQVWPGETISVKGTVTKKYSDNGQNLLDVDISEVNTEGEEKVQGHATVVVPS